MELIIKRSRWYRGHGSHGSGLLREDGTKCCLGFFATQCGYSDQAILNKCFLKEITADCKIPESVLNILDMERSIAVLNDQFLHSAEDEREKVLTNKFAQLGIQVKFED